MSESNKFNSSVLKRVIRLGYEHKFIFVFSITISTFLAFIGSYRPKFIKQAIDVDYKNKDYEGLVETLSWLGGLLLIEIILQFLFIYSANLLAEYVIKNLRTRLFKKIMGFKLSYFDTTPNGVIVTRSVSDLSTIAQIFNEGILVIMGDIQRIFFVVIAMYLMNWKLASIVILILPIMLLITVFFQRALKTVFQEERTQIANLNTFVQERLSGMNIVQLFNRERIEYRQFLNINNKLRKAYLKTVLYFSFLFPVIELISSLAIAVLIVMGGWSAIENSDVEPGAIVAFTVYINMLVRPIRLIADRFNNMQRGLVSSERVFDILDKDLALPDEGTIDNQEIKGNIEFKNVHFSYDGKQKILNNISFSVKQGETVAIVGTSGSGKSTIINLLSRFYDLSEGEITIDNINIKEFKLDFLRKKIAVVLQDVFLFNDTILNNITLGRTDISLEQVKAAAKKIDLHDFIESLPNGYQYKVSERGSSISVGQRQLISFLRAYVYNPTILVLDEATSSIDTNTEKKIQQATEQLSQARTSIVIAHRLATIVNADKILVMDKGQIIEEGNHNDLLQIKNGFYRGLYENQLKGLK